MAIPTSMSSGGLLYRRSGVRIAAFPSDPTFWIEVQCSTSTGYATSRTRLQKFTPTVANFVVATFEVPYSTRRYFARARHYKVGYTTGPWTNLGSDLPGALVGGMPDVQKLATRMSSLHNLQGSIIPFSLATGPFTINMGGDGSGASASMWAEWSWSSFNIRLADQSTVVVPSNTSMLAQPPNPVTGTVAGGALAGRTYVVRIGYIKNGCYMGVSNEVSQVVGANNLLTVTAPAKVVGMDGWAVLIGIGANNEKSQHNAGNADLLQFGSNFTEPVGGANTGAGFTPYDTNWNQRIVMVGLLASTSYKAYPYYDLASAFVSFGTTGATVPFNTTASDVMAQVQNGDQHYPCSTTAVGFTEPAASGTGSGTGGGGNKL